MRDLIDRQERSASLASSRYRYYCKAVLVLVSCLSGSDSTSGHRSLDLSIGIDSSVQSTPYELNKLS